MATKPKAKLTLKNKRIFTFNGTGSKNGNSTDPTILPTTSMMTFIK
ncbi:hypothetical protein [Pontibacter indicus]|uniref:Uncharacterized protein n=1 Tax=Pontibacter indicus TaxID=1317125 RepID=A0A1R3XQ43_9BACT|nr:hypothetical protein [Pontibacter indicus]SIT94060.1 hypothetical protein SAMN05444128_3419 [Pontibacter indicus]